MEKKQQKQTSLKKKKRFVFKNEDLGFEGMNEPTRTVIKTVTYRSGYL
jgi:hypothetical protein